MKPSRSSIGSKAAFLLLALMIAFWPITVEAQPVVFDDIGSESGRSDLIEQIASDVTPVLLQPNAPLTRTMTISHTLSDEAQRNTLAFDGLAFLTGSLGADSFFPPARWLTFWAFNTCAITIPARWGPVLCF